MSETVGGQGPTDALMAAPPDPTPVPEAATLQADLAELSATHERLAARLAAADN